MIYDDLDALTPGPVETLAFWLLVALMLGLCVGLVSFATGLLWSDYIHPGLLWVAGWLVGPRS